MIQSHFNRLHKNPELKIFFLKNIERQGKISVSKTEVAFDLHHKAWFTFLILLCLKSIFHHKYLNNSFFFFHTVDIS